MERVSGEEQKFNKFFAYTHWLPVIDVSFVGRSVDGFDNSICKGGKEKEDVEEFLNFRKQTSLVCKLKIQRILKWLRM